MRKRLYGHELCAQRLSNLYCVWYNTCVWMVEWEGVIKHIEYNPITRECKDVSSDYSVSGST
jgi:hypothetical protein